MALAIEKFDVDDVSEEKKNEMLEAFARKVVRKRFEVPAAFFLEAHKPVSFIFSQSLLLSAPVLGAFFGFREVNQWARIFEERQNVTTLIEKIEALARDRDADLSKKDGRKKS